MKNGNETAITAVRSSAVIFCRKSELHLETKSKKQKPRVAELKDDAFCDGVISLPKGDTTFAELRLSLLSRMCQDMGPL